MIVKLHKNARTTPAIRAQLAASNESVAVLAKRFNLAPNTVRKWQARTVSKVLPIVKTKID